MNYGCHLFFSDRLLSFSSYMAQCGPLLAENTYIYWIWLVQTGENFISINFDKNIHTFLYKQGWKEFEI